MIFLEIEKPLRKGSLIVELPVNRDLAPYLVSGLRAPFVWVARASASGMVRSGVRSLSKYSEIEILLALAESHPFRVFSKEQECLSYLDGYDIPDVAKHSLPGFATTVYASRRREYTGVMMKDTSNDSYSLLVHNPIRGIAFLRP